MNFYHVPILFGAETAEEATNVQRWIDSVLVTAWSALPVNNRIPLPLLGKAYELRPSGELGLGGNPYLK